LRAAFREDFLDAARRRRDGLFRDALFLFERFARRGTAAACSLRRAVAQPSLFICRPRAIPSAFGGTFSVMIDPAAT